MSAFRSAQFRYGRWVLAGSVISAIVLFAGNAFAATPYNQKIVCRGSTVEQPNGYDANLKFELNVFNESESYDDISYSYAGHRVTIEYPTAVFDTTPLVTEHLDRVPYLCTQEGNLVSCEGYGVGNGQEELKLVIDLQTMTATGFNDQATRGWFASSPRIRHDFDAYNRLTCSF